VTAIGGAHTKKVLSFKHSITARTRSVAAVQA
jgi:hypothetical protein